MSTNEAKFDQWAIVELFGHTRIAGRITEQTIGGCSFVRVDVPEIEFGNEGWAPAVTKLFGQGAIYSMTFVDEAAATVAAREIRYQPIDVWSLRRGLEGMSTSQRQQALGLSEDDDNQF